MGRFSFGRLPQGDFVQRLFQYDSQSREMGMNARLRWTFRPGSDLFFVWNRNWAHPAGEGRFDLGPTRDQVALKVRFAWTG